MEFNHEKLKVYQVSLKLLSAVFKTIEKMPPGFAFMRDQLKRASLSIPLNIAEGNAKFSLKERARFFKIARASANECATIFDAGSVLQIMDGQTCQQSKSLFKRENLVLWARS